MAGSAVKVASTGAVNAVATTQSISKNVISVSPTDDLRTVLGQTNGLTRTIYLAPGTYRVSRDTEALTARNVNLVAQPGASIAFGGELSIIASGGRTVYWKNIEIVSSYAADSNAILVAGTTSSDKVVFEACNFVRNAGSGDMMEVSGTVTDRFQAVFRNCRFSSTVAGQSDVGVLAISACSATFEGTTIVQSEVGTGLTGHSPAIAIASGTTFIAKGSFTLKGRIVISGAVNSANNSSQIEFEDLSVNLESRDLPAINVIAPAAGNELYFTKVVFHSLRVNSDVGIPAITSAIYPSAAEITGSGSTGTVVATITPGGSSVDIGVAYVSGTVTSLAPVTTGIRGIWTLLLP